MRKRGEREMGGKRAVNCHDGGGDGRILSWEAALERIVLLS